MLKFGLFSLGELKLKLKLLNYEVPKVIRIAVRV